MQQLAHALVGQVQGSSQVGLLALVEVYCLLAVALLAQIQVQQPKEALPIRACLEVVVGEALLLLGIRSCYQAGQPALVDGAGRGALTSCHLALLQEGCQVGKASVHALLALVVVGYTGQAVLDAGWRRAWTWPLLQVPVLCWVGQRSTGQAG